MFEIGPASVAFTDRSDIVSLPPADVRRYGPRSGAVVAEGRARVARRLGFDAESAVFMRQVHGAEACYVTTPFRGDPLPVDGVCTDRSGLALAVLVADCAPVLLVDPYAAVIGAAHAGRPGTEGGVIAAVAEVMVSRGADPARMTALIGPCVCPLCYEVPDAMRAAMAAKIPQAHAVTRRGTPAIDIRAAITAQLGHTGVVDVRHDHRCTVETPELYSYRREGATGDFAAYIWLRGRENAITHEVR